MPIQKQSANSQSNCQTECTKTVNRQNLQVCILTSLVYHLLLQPGIALRMNESDPTVTEQLNAHCAVPLSTFAGGPPAKAMQP